MYCVGVLSECHHLVGLWLVGCGRRLMTRNSVFDGAKENQKKENQITLSTPSTNRVCSLYYCHGLRYI